MAPTAATCGSTGAMFWKSPLRPGVVGWPRNRIRLCIVTHASRLVELAILGLKEMAAPIFPRLCVQGDADASNSSALKG